MLNVISQFKDDESGAVTVDWVVLTAAIVGIALAVIGLVSSGVGTASEGINGELETAGTFSDIFASASIPYGLDSGFVPFSQGGYDLFYNDATSFGVDTAAYYDSAYQDAVSFPGASRLDRLAASEQALIDGGLDVPSGNSSAAELQANAGLI